METGSEVSLGWSDLGCAFGESATSEMDSSNFMTSMLNAMSWASMGTGSQWGFCFQVARSTFVSRYQTVREKLSLSMASRHRCAVVASTLNAAVRRQMSSVLGLLTTSAGFFFSM